VPLCCTLGHIACATVLHSVTFCLYHCAAQWDITLVPLCCTVGHISCATVLHSRTYCLCHCAAHWDILLVLLCCTVGHIACATVLHSGTYCLCHCAQCSVDIQPAPPGRQQFVTSSNFSVCHPAVVIISFRPT